MTDDAPSVRYPSCPRCGGVCVPDAAAARLLGAIAADAERRARAGRLAHWRWWLADALADMIEWVRGDE